MNNKLLSIPEQDLKMLLNKVNLPEDINLKKVSVGQSETIMREWKQLQKKRLLNRRKPKNSVKKEVKSKSLSEKKLTKLIQEYKLKNEELNNQVQTKVKELKEAEEKLNSLAKKNDDLFSENKEFRTKLAETISVKEYNQLQDSVNHQRNVNIDMIVRFREAKLEIKEYKKNLIELRESETKLKNKLTNEKNHVKSLSKKINSLETADIIEMRKGKATVEKKYQEFKLQVTKQLKEKDSLLDKYKKELKLKENRLKNLVAEKLTVGKQLKQLTDRMTATNANEYIGVMNLFDKYAKLVDIETTRLFGVYSNGVMETYTGEILPNVEFLGKNKAKEGRVYSGYMDSGVFYVNKTYLNLDREQVVTIKSKKKIKKEKVGNDLETAYRKGILADKKIAVVSMFNTKAIKAEFNKYSVDVEMINPKEKSIQQITRMFKSDNIDLLYVIIRGVGHDVTGALSNISEDYKNNILIQLDASAKKLIEESITFFTEEEA